MNNLKQMQLCFLAVWSLTWVVGNDAFSAEDAKIELFDMAAIRDPATLDVSVIKDIEKAILKSDLGLTPSNDGKMIRISIPPLTEERRKQLVKVVYKKGEEHRVAVRNQRRDANDLLKGLKKDGEIAEDDAFRAQDQIQKITDEHVKLVDDVCKDKEKEILEF